jgi:DNA-binding LacI/PurR family transcriptional regulator
MSSQRPTISDIAIQAGLAATTVAAALRGESRIALATRERVTKIAAACGYQRNLAASVLGAQRHRPTGGMLAAALLVHLDDKLGSPYSRSYQEYFSRAGWLFKTVNLKGSNFASKGRLLRQQGIDAVLYGQTTPTDMQMHDFPWSYFASLSLLRHRVAEGFDTVRVNHSSAVLKLAREITSRGYRRIGIIHRAHDPALEEDNVRLAACLLLQHRPAPLDATFRLFYLPFHPEIQITQKVVEKLDRWIKQNQLEVIVGFNHSDQEPILQTGRSIPQDIAFAAIHTFRNDQPTVAGLAAPAEVLPGLAALRLEQKLKLGDLGLSSQPVESVVTPEFFPGASLPDRGTP